jgi:uncharacterized membrane protein YdfJ with MMPL/SSD domain
MTIEDLAGMVKHGFEDVENRLGDRMAAPAQTVATKDDLARLEQHLIARLDTIRQDIADLDNLRKCVAHLEDLLKVVQ